ncbi:acyltransferase family protein [Paenibacillus taichungensis]|uniref:acyltransferase family protein n=1 Tax=Paenibacillus taichungensis TaxID=484184 RepID=UPI0038D0D14A
MKKELVPEVVWLRCIACLAIVAIHCINLTFTNYEGFLTSQTVTLLEVIKLGLLFGTPAFVFISEFLLAKSYSTYIPDKFLWKRVRYILIPYFTMAVVYAFYSLIRSGELTPYGLVVKILRNIVVADYIAYFIIVIFQFYILHIIFTKYFQSLSPKLFIPLCLAINLLYLGFFNFVPPLQFIPGAEYIWTRLYWVAFPGWLFYFSVAYQCGKNYTAFKEFLNRNIKWIILIPILTFLAITFLKFKMILPETNSKRIDILFYAISMVFVIFYFASKLKRIPRVIDQISRYSFGIYLLHLMFVQTISKFFSELHPFINLPLTFIVSISLSIIFTYLLHKLKIGNYFVGKIGISFTRTNKANKHNDSWVETEIKV